jgi:ADP-dependent phosphofructokinase/glucokinase
MGQKSEKIKRSVSRPRLRRGKIEIDEIARNLCSNDPAERLRIALRLGKIGGSGAVGYLRVALYDDDAVVQLGATLALGAAASKIKDMELIPDAVVDRFGAIRLQNDPIYIATEALLREARYAQDPVAKAAEAALASIEQAGLLRGLVSVGADIREAVETVQTFINEPIDKAPEIYERVSKLAQVMGWGDFRAIDLQLQEDRNKLEKHLPKNLADVEFDVGELVHTWAGRFKQVQTQMRTTGKRTLSLYGTVTDNVITLTPNNVQTFIEAGAREAGPEDLIKTMTGGKPTEVRTLAEVIGAVLWAMNKKRGDKAQIGSAELETKIRGFIEGLEGVEISPRLGGASGNMAINLPPGEDITIFTTTNHADIAKLFPDDRITKLEVRADGFRSDRLMRESGNIEEPNKHGYVVEFRPGISIYSIGGFQLEEPIVIEQMDRHIFTAPTVGEEKPVKPYIEFPESVDESRKARILRGIGREFSLTLFNGLQYLKGEGDFEEMNAQIEGIKAGGSKTHCALSSVSKGNLGYIRGVLAGRINSIGMNEGELITVADFLEAEGLIRADKDGTEISLVHNALRIAKALDVDRVYVHGSGFDFVVRRNTIADEMDREVLGGMYSKFAIVQKLVEGRVDTGKKIHENVKIEGLESMMDISDRLSDEIGLTKEARDRFMSDLLMRGHGDLGEKWSIALFPSKWIYDQKAILFPTGAGDTMEAYDSIYGYMGS